MRIGFVTCVQLGLSCIEEIYRAGYKLDTIFTLHDHLAVGKSGRVFVDDFARIHSIAIQKISHVNDQEVIDKCKKLDWLFIIGWSQIASADVINAPRNGVLGIHPSLLPVGRGRAAIPWAILKGLKKTGITLFKLDEGVDTGPIVAQIEIQLHDDTTATDLYQKVDKLHVQLIGEVLPELVTGSVELILQDESEATIWPGRRPEDGRIDLNGSIEEADRLVRATTKPYPGAYYLDQCGDKVIVWSASKSDVRPAGNFLEFEDGYLLILQQEKLN